MKTKPYKHQQTAYDMSKDLEDFAYFMEMGTGKSKVALDNACYLFEQKKINGLFILANNGSYRNWPETQIPEHMWDSVRMSSYIGVWKEDSGDIISNPLIDPNKLFLKIFVMNAEALAHERGYNAALEFVKHRRCLLVADESTLFKNKDSKRTKAAAYLATKAAYRRIMTGDPINNSPLDIWGQCLLLRPKILRFSSFYAFRAYFADMIDMPAGGRSFKKIVGYKNLDFLNNTLKSFSYRVKKEDCLDLPPKVYQKVYVEMTKEQAKLYEQIREESIAELTMAEGRESVIITATLAMTKAVKLHQIVCGHVKDDDGQIHRVKNNRIDAMLDTLEESPGKVIIWANYIEDIKAIREAIFERFEEDPLCYYGATSEDDRVIAVKEFQEGAARFFVSNKAGAFGLTLTRAQTVVYYSNGFELEIRRQSEDRAHRIGQNKSVNYVDLICKGTVDEKIIKSLRNNSQVSAATIGDKWREWI